MTSRFLTFIALMLCLVALLPAKVEIEAEVGFDGFYIPGEWTPIQVLLSNLPDPTDSRPPQNLTGTLRVVTQSYTGRPFVHMREVDLPANSRKLIWLVIKAAAIQGNAPPIINVEYRADNRRGRADTAVAGRPLPVDSGLVLVVREPGRPAVLQLPGVSSSQSFTVASVPRLPDQWAALSGVVAIFLPRNTGVNLEPEEVEALRIWLEQGGVLVVDGGGGSTLMGSAIDELLPVDVGERTTYHVDGSGNFTVSPPRADAPENRSAVLASATLREGSQVLWSNADGGVLAAEKPIGLGRVAFLAWDLNNELMRAHPRAETILARLVPPPSSVMGQERFHQFVLSNISPDPSVSLPSLFLIFFLLLIYWIVVGPLNYFHLRKRKRIELAWITIPLIIIGFCGLFFAIGYLTRSNRDSLRHINVAVVQSGSATARVHSIALHFSAAKQRVDYRSSIPEATLSQVSFWETDDAPLMALPQQRDQWGMPGQWGGGRNTAFNIRGTESLRSLRDSSDPAPIQQDSVGMELDNQLLRQWSFAYIESSAPVGMNGTLDVECSFAATQGQQGFQLQGHLTNNTDFSLEQVAVLWGGECWPIQREEIGPGQTVEFTASQPGNASQGLSENRRLYEQSLLESDDTQIKLATLRGIFRDDSELPWLNPQSGRPHLIAFTDQPLLAPEPDREVERLDDITLLMMELPLEVADPEPFILTSPEIPLNYTIHASSDLAVRIDRAWGQSSESMGVSMIDSNILVTYELPWAGDVDVDVTGVWANIECADSPDQIMHLWALNRLPGSGPEWIEVPIRPELNLQGPGYPISASNALDGRRVVDPITREVTLRVEATAREGRSTIGGSAARLTRLGLTVSGVARPLKTEQAEIPTEEPIS